MDDLFSEIEAALERTDQAEKQAVTKAKKAKEKKKPETLEEAFDRVLGMKLKDDERDVVLQIKQLIMTDEIERKDTSKKLSKKEVFELYQQYQSVLREKKKQHIIDTKPENVWIVQDSMTLEKVRQMLATEPLTSWDTETDGLDTFNCVIVGWSVYMPKHDIALYVPFGHTTGQAQVAEEAALFVAKEYLSNSNNQTAWHHFKYDGHLFLNHEIEVANPVWDTQVAAKLLNEHESAKLKDLYVKYVMDGVEEAVYFNDLFDDAVIYDKDIILSGIYAAGDAYKTHKLMEFQKPFIDNRDNLRTVWYSIEKHLLKVDLQMERTGFCIDQEKVDELIGEYTPVLEKAERDLLQAFQIDPAFLAKMGEALGNTFDALNVNSNPQLAYLIYDHLGVDDDFGKKFKKASRSTAADVVDAICSDYEELKPLLKYRQLHKLLNTYLRKIPLSMEPKTGRLHSRFNNMSGEDKSNGTATGRYSSSEYVSGKNSKTGDVKKGSNLQNIPSKGIGVEIRRCFVPRNKDWVFLSGDLSQIEPRVISVILAEQYGDYAMQNFYKEGKDLYIEMSMFAFGFEREYCVDGAYDPTGSFQPRKLMKQGVLSFLYGSSAKSFAREMKISENVAAEFFEKMINAFPGLEVFRNDVIKKLLTKGNVAYAETLFGRKRRFPEYRKNYYELQRLNKILIWKMTKEEQSLRNDLWKKVAGVERAALNMIVQGSAADILKQIMVKMSEFVKENDYEFNASIHDELITSVPKADLTPELVETFSKIFTETVTFSTPLKTDVVISERWMDDVKASDWDYENQCPKVAA